MILISILYTVLLVIFGFIIFDENRTIHMQRHELNRLKRQIKIYEQFVDDVKKQYNLEKMNISNY